MQNEDIAHFSSEHGKQASNGIRQSGMGALVHAAEEREITLWRPPRRKAEVADVHKGSLRFAIKHVDGGIAEQVLKLVE
jgi:hypothetical protein